MLLYEEQVLMYILNELLFFDKLKNFIKYSKGWNLRYNLTKKERIINNIEKKP